MPKLEEPELSLIDPDPSQPRKHFEEGAQLELADDLKRNGQKIPILVYRSGPRFTLIDGERRWRAAKIGGLKRLSALVYDGLPSPAEIQLTQLTIDVHRRNLSAMEKSNFLAKLQAEQKWSVGELSERATMKQGTVSKLLALQKLPPEIQQAVHAGLDSEKAYLISQEPDPAKQQALFQQATSVSRQQLHRQVRGNARPTEVKVPVAQFAMPGGMSVSLRGRDLTLTLAIEVLTETVRMLKKGQNQGLDIGTAIRVFKDTSRAAKHG